MKKLSVLFLVLSSFFAFISCNNNSSDKKDNNNEFKKETEWKFKVIKEKKNGYLKLYVIDKDSNFVKFDDDNDYSECEILEYAFYADDIMDYCYTTLEDCYKSITGKEARIKKGVHSEMTDDYVDFINQYINNVFNVPIKDEIKDEKLKEFFNKPYYNYKDYKIYSIEKGYGFARFMMSENGKQKYSYLNGVPIPKYPTLRFHRTDDGFLEIDSY